MTLKLLPNFEKLIEDFCGDCELRGLTSETVRRYRSSILIFTEYLEKKETSLHEINMQYLKDFLRYLRKEREVKYKTIENYFSALSALYDYLTFEGITSTNIILPFRKRYLRRYKQNYDDPERKLLTVEEMSRLVNCIMDPRDRTIVVLLAKTGVRLSLIHI